MKKITWVWVLLILLTVHVVAAANNTTETVVVQESSTKNSGTSDENMNLAFFEIIQMLCAGFIVVASFLPSQHNIRKLARYFTYYILPPLLLVMGILYPQRSFFAEMGTTAERLLFFLLIVRPLAKITGFKFLHRIVGYRRELGVASFWFFLVHATGLIIIRELTDINYFWTTPYLFWGLAAGIGMLLLAITSNRKSVMLLKKNWKKLQYLTYVVFLGVLTHSGLAIDGNLNKLYVLGGIFITLKILEWSGIKLHKQHNS